MASWFVTHWTLDHPLGDEDTNRKIQEALFNKKEIGIHYADTCAVHQNDHGYNLYGHAGRHSINRLVTLAEEGGYVCAHYPAIQRTLIGKFEPLRVDRIRCDEDLFFIKRLPFNSAKEVFTEAKEMLHAMRPIQGTIVHWHRIRLLLQLMVEQQKIGPTIGIFPPPIQETLCQEYLRSEFGLQYLLLPFGRNLETVDASGMSQDGHRIFSQVTNADQLGTLIAKAEDLQNYSNSRKAKRVFFCPEQSKQLIENDFKQCMDFVSFETVDKWLMNRKQKEYRKALFSWLL